MAILPGVKDVRSYLTLSNSQMLGMSLDLSQIYNPGRPPRLQLTVGETIERGFLDGILHAYEYVQLKVWAYPTSTWCPECNLLSDECTCTSFGALDGSDFPF